MILGNFLETLCLTMTIGTPVDHPGLQPCLYERAVLLHAGLVETLFIKGSLIVSLFYSKYWQNVKYWNHNNRRQNGDK
jgi:hypothetical protein